MKAYTQLLLLCSWTLNNAFDVTKSAGIYRQPSCLSIRGPQRTVRNSIVTVFVTEGKANFDCDLDRDLDLESNPYDDPDPKARPMTITTSELRQIRVHREKLQKLGLIKKYITTDNPDDEWEWFYGRLELRYNTQSTKNRPTDPIEEALVRYWMAEQRKSFMKTLGVLNMTESENWGTVYLSRERKERLDKIGFHWGHLQSKRLSDDDIYSKAFQRLVIIKYKDWIWNPKFDSLVLFHQMYRHTNVPHDYEDGLGKWTAQQRLIRLDMPPRRREKLDSILFDWSWKDPNTVIVQDTELPVETKKVDKFNYGQRVAQLKSYRRANGHCAVPLDYEDVPGLGLWVEGIRGRRHELRPSSIAKLEMIGLVFDAPMKV